MRFTKMHGIGNDYVYIDGFSQDVKDPSALARRLSDRHRGVGGDGLIIIRPPLTGDSHCRMEMYNADGTRAEMCGNGIRCVGKYVFDHGLVLVQEINVATDAGLKRLRLELGDDGNVTRVEVNMGAPVLEREAIPFRDGGPPDERAVDVPLVVLGRTFRMTAVSMGNPHAVIRLDRPGEQAVAPFRNVDEIPLAEWGPAFERHEWFPERTNTEFITLPSRTEMEFRVWERGSGETLACGTGACAAVVAGVLNDWCASDVVIHLRGGDLRVRWDGDDVLMTGPAEEVFSGEWPDGGEG